MDELATRKGIKDGFVGLVRPFGEKIHGKVVVRDSAGASRAWEDFGVHFVDLAELAKDGASSQFDSQSTEKLEELMEYYVGEGSRRRTMSSDGERCRRSTDNF